MDVQIESQNIQ